MQTIPETAAAELAARDRQNVPGRPPETAVAIVASSGRYTIIQTAAGGYEFWRSAAGDDSPELLIDSSPYLIPRWYESLAVWSASSEETV
jgi:hypothetical protein